MEKPDGAKQAELIIWLTLGVSALVALVDKWMGVISAGELAGALLLYGLLCIIPYKIGQGSNAARYVYTVFFAISVLVMLGGGLSMPRLDFIAGVFMLPVEVYIIYRLFQPEASEWFTRHTE